MVSPGVATAGVAMLGGALRTVRGGHSPAFRARRCHSARREVKSAPAEARRAMVTKAGRAASRSIVGSASRMISRRQRFRRLRTGAHPMALGTMTPAINLTVFGWFTASGWSKNPMANNFPPTEEPRRRTASNSRRRVIRTGRGKLIARGEAAGSGPHDLMPGTAD